MYVLSVKMTQEQKTLIDKSTESFKFDDIWNVLPHISWYQYLLLAICGLNTGFGGGTLVMYPIFTQYEPPYSCIDQKIDPCSANCTEVIFDRSMR